MFSRSSLPGRLVLASFAALVFGPLRSGLWGSSFSGPPVRRQVDAVGTDLAQGDEVLQRLAGRPGPSYGRGRITLQATGQDLGALAAAADAQSSGLAAGPLAFQVVSGCVVLYCIMSLNEYVFHRYFQHLGLNRLSWVRPIREALNLPTWRGDGHVEHHRETEDDMSLDQRSHPMLDADPWRGTAFPWWAFFGMVVSVEIPAYPLLSLLGWSPAFIIPSVFVAVSLHALIWNALHPDMHGLPDVPVEHGPPSWPLKGLRGSPLFEALRINHEGHHRIDGAHGNYNVCCPLVDVLAGTYVGVIPASPRADAVSPAGAAAAATAAATAAAVAVAPAAETTGVA